MRHGWCFWKSPPQDQSWICNIDPGFNILRVHAVPCFFPRCWQCPLWPFQSGLDDVSSSLPLPAAHYWLIYFWLRRVFTALCGLSLVAGSGGCSWLRGTGFSLWWPLLLLGVGTWPSVVAAQGLSSCSPQALELRLSSYCRPRASLVLGMWDLPRPGLEPMSLALAGGFLTTGPPGKSLPMAHYDREHLLNQNTDTKGVSKSSTIRWGSFSIRNQMLPHSIPGQSLLGLEHYVPRAGLKTCTEESCCLDGTGKLPSLLPCCASHLAK